MAKNKLSLQVPRSFNKKLQRLRQEGGRSREVFKKVTSAVALWKVGEEADLNRTHHGETRVPHAVKYDLPGYYRLVAREHEGVRILLHVGTHDDVDQWLEANRGRDYTYDKETREIAFGSLSSPPEVVTAGEQRLTPIFDRRGYVFDAIPRDDWNALGLARDTQTAIQRFATFEQCNEKDICHLLQGLEYPNQDVKTAVLNAYLNLLENNAKAAIACVRRVVGKAASASEDPTGFSANVKGGGGSTELMDVGLLNLDELEALLDPARFSEWMVYLAPEQRKLVEREFSGPARILGVSGSGKTCVLVHRASYLAKKYPDQRILILALGRSLERLIRYLLDELCTGSHRKQIEVVSIYDYCYRMVKAIEPARLIEQEDPRSGEDLQRCWRDFLDKPHAKDSVDRIFSALHNRDDPVKAPEAYVLEELIWIRSGFGVSDRQQYLECDRLGRGIPMPKWSQGKPAKSEYGKMPEDARSRLLQLLHDYEEYMEWGGLLDQDGVSLAAFDLRDRLDDRPDLRARCVLVDEVQDVSTNELAVIAQIPTAEQDGLFLCGDPVQKVFPKQQNLVRAGIDIRGRSAILRRNYRNTRQILTAAFTIIDEFASLAAIPESEIIRPEYAYREGEKPILYECASREEQIQLTMSWVESLSPEDQDATCICSSRIETLQALVEACKARGIQTAWLTGEQRYDEKGLKISELEFVKGYEFRSVYVLDLSDRDLPAKGTPWEERWRDAFHIYVAMTRARDDLSLMFVSNRSILLGPLQNTVEEEDAKTVLT